MRLIGLGLLCLSAAGCAASGFDTQAAIPADAVARFQALDANGDGLIRQHELAGDARLESRFVHADRDRNGSIDPPEFIELTRTR